MLMIRDESLAQTLRQIAEREGRPVEDVLKTMVAHYPLETPAPTNPGEMSEAVKRVRRKAYNKAREFWLSIGDAAKAALTDDELDEQFGAFDEEGVPRLKDELASEPPAGSLAYAAQIAENSNLHSGKPDLARRSDELLDQHFADDFTNRMKGQNEDE